MGLRHRRGWNRELLCIRSKARRAFLLSINAVIAWTFEVSLNANGGGGNFGELGAASAETAADLNLVVI